MSRDEFEVIDQRGARWRYKYSEGYSWQFGIKPGTIDAEDKTVAEVLLRTSEDEEAEVVQTFVRITMIGDVTENSCLNLNLAERGRMKP